MWAIVLGGTVSHVSCRKAEVPGDVATADPVVPALAAEAFVEAPPPVVVAPPPFAHDKSAQVSILLYHEFSSAGNATDMTIPTVLFREQMQAIKDSGEAVISLEDFLAWKRGEKNIPNPSIMITMDDGWKSVYTDAYPILKEFGFPFTIFLYTNYVASGSKSMTVDQIKELLANGASLGCHSRSHPYPPAVRGALAKGPEEAAVFFRKEMVEPADKLASLLGTRPKVYAYPGGFHLPEMHAFADEAKYEALFTVNPAKVTWETPMKEIHRYVIHGKVPSTFVAATSFRGIPLGRRLLGPDNKELHLTVAPAEGTTVDVRQPLLTADLSPVPDLDPASIMLRVAGIGRVNPEFDPETRQLRYQIPVRLRSGDCSVFLYWKRLNVPEYDAPLVWKFKVDLRASLLNDIPPPPKGAIAPPPVTRVQAAPPPDNS